jgi:hypothetical protein
VTSGSYAEYFDGMCDAGIGDGLPLVPPTSDRVERFLVAAGIDGDEEIVSTGIVASDAAASAVAAGCLPEYAGIVFAAIKSFASSIEPNRATLSDSALVTVVNGPIRLPVDMNCSDALLGPGWRSNATIGRALRLFATGPLGLSMSAGFGDPGQYSLCFGEDEEKSEWLPLHVERGYSSSTSAVTVFPAPIYRQVMDLAHSESKGVIEYVSLFIRGRASGTSLFREQPVSLMVLIGQELRRILAPDFTKASLRGELFERITAVDGSPFGPISMSSENDISVVAAGGVAFPALWVFTTPAPSPKTVPIVLP